MERETKKWMWIAIFSPWWMLFFVPWWISVGAIIVVGLLFAIPFLDKDFRDL